MLEVIVIVDVAEDVRGINTTEAGRYTLCPVSNFSFMVRND